MVIARSRSTLAADPRANAARQIAACRRGDKGAWDELVGQYGRVVYSVPRRYGLCPADADDVFQAVFITLFRRLDTIREPDRLHGWLITTAHRECWRIGRKTGHVADPVDWIEDLAGPAEEDALRWEQQDQVRTALERLGGRCEALLTALFTASGAPDYEAIAVRLGIKPGSIGPTRARCFRKLERILLEIGVEPPTEASAGGVTGPDT